MSGHLERRLMLERVYNDARSEVLSVDTPASQRPSGQLSDADLKGVSARVEPTGDGSGS